ncbi:MAG: alpha-L-fucosidase [Lentisphaeria bacterium]|nr:alpha-L-fucosidase [Lentisphaeria bacterium]
MSIPQPLPRIAAFEKLGFGMFVHWGLYSQFGQGEWSRHLHNYPQAEYEKLKDTFTAEDFDAELLARTAKETGMRYIVLTTRHHEGFSLYDTCGLNDFDAPHSPAGRDLVAEFVAACRKYGIVPFFYHTTLDWRWHGKKTPELSKEEFKEYLIYLRKSVEILCRNYGEIGGLWFDGNWSRKGDDWEEDALYSLIRKYQPEAMIINNTGLGDLGKLGHPELDSVTYENNAARPMNREGMEKYVAAEVCRTLNHHWGVGANDLDFQSPGDIISLLCHSRRCGANFLLNIGPAAQGGIPDYERALLALVGRWVKLFGEAIYEPKTISGIRCQNKDFMLQNGKTAYYFAYGLGICGDYDVTVGVEGVGSRTVDGFSEKIRSAYWMDNGEKIDVIQDLEKSMTALKCTGFPYGSNTVVRVMKLELE